jgi:hypothetical protein
MGTQYYLVQFIIPEELKFADEKDINNDIVARISHIADGKGNLTKRWNRSTNDEIWNEIRFWGKGSALKNAVLVVDDEENLITSVYLAWNDEIKIETPVDATHLLSGTDFFPKMDPTIVTHSVQNQSIFNITNDDIHNNQEPEDRWITNAIKLAFLNLDWSRYRSDGKEPTCIKKIRKLLNDLDKRKSSEMKTLLKIDKVLHSNDQPTSDLFNKFKTQDDDFEDDILFLKGGHRYEL